MKRIVYMSSARAGLDDAMLERLVTVARERNARHDITGLLLFNGVYFIQALEGQDMDVDFVMSLIMSDQRHHDIRIIAEDEVGEREFADWAMQLVRFGTRADIEQDLEKRLPSGVRQALMKVA